MIKDFNKIVNKMGKKGGKVIFKKDIFEFIDPEYKSQYSSYVNKLIYRLKSEGIIISLKSGVYIVPDREDEGLNSIDLLEKYYLKLLKKYITGTVGSQYYISGNKSLEFHMKDFSIPERIYVMNRNIDKKIKIGSYEIVFKTLSGRDRGKRINLFSRFYPYSKELMVEGISLKVSGLELALVESALVSDIYEGLDMGILIRAIKKYASVMSEDTFHEIGKYKYNMAFNRLKEISKTIHPHLYKVFLDIIKQNGGCFIGEGLRGI